MARGAARQAPIARDSGDVRNNKDKSGADVDSREDPLGATWLASRYQVAGLRARGALSLIYQGQDAVLQRPVAIKAPLKAHTEAYRATLEVTANLAHPAFLALYDVIEQGDGLFLAYEFVHGRPLSDYLSAGLPLRRALAIILQVARAIAYAHAHGVTHGDLTLAAVLVDRSANARIANVGLEADNGYFDEVATYAFASNIADDPDASASILTQDPQRLDVWSITAMLWLLVTDTRDPSPVDGSNESSPRARIFRGDTPDQARLVIERALRVSHTEPLASADDLVAVLAALQTDLSGVIESEEAVPATIMALRAERQRASDAVAAMISAPGVRWEDSSSYGASPTATTSYGEVRHGGYAPLDGNTTQPSHDEPLGAEIDFSARAPRLSLPARPVGAPNSRFLDAGRPLTPAPAAPRAASHAGLGVWIWTLISLAVFAICFLAGFFLAGLATFPSLR